MTMKSTPLQLLTENGIDHDLSVNIVTQLTAVGVADPASCVNLFSGRMAHYFAQGDVTSFANLTFKLRKLVVSGLSTDDRASMRDQFHNDRFHMAISAMFEQHVPKTIASLSVESKTPILNFNVDGEEPVSTLAVQSLISFHARIHGHRSQVDIVTTPSFAAIKHFMRSIRAPEIKLGGRGTVQFLSPMKITTQFDAKSKPNSLKRMLGGDDEMDTVEGFVGVNALRQYRTHLLYMARALEIACCHVIPDVHKDKFTRSSVDVRVTDPDDGVPKYLYGGSTVVSTLMLAFDEAIGFTSVEEADKAVHHTMKKLSAHMSSGYLVGTAMAKAVSETTAYWLDEPRVQEVKRVQPEPVIPVGLSAEFAAFMKSQGSGKTRDSRKSNKKSGGVCKDYNSAAGCKLKASECKSTHRCGKCGDGGHPTQRCKK